MSDGLFRIRAWVHYVSANPLNDDQLLLAKDVATILEQLARAKKLLGKVAPMVEYLAADIVTERECTNERIYMQGLARAALKELRGEK